MSADMQIFNYNGFTDIRTITMDNDLWWVLRDVCVALSLTSPNKVASRLDEDEWNLIPVTDVYGREQKTLVVNEAGLYSVILRSDKPSAKDFKRWITHEVIPSIRKTGTYTASAAPAPMSPAQLIAAQAQILVDMEQKMAQIQGQTNAMQKQLEAAQNQYDTMAQKVDNAIKVLSRPSEDHWKADMDRAIKELCEQRHLSDCATRGRMYRDLEQKVNCNISSRLARLRERKKKQGCRHRDAMLLNKLDAIAADKQLRAAFELVLKEWQARSIVIEGQKEIIEQDEFELVD